MCDLVLLTVGDFLIHCVGRVGTFGFEEVYCGDYC